ncbi:transferrin-binding protein-like solute binding protein [Moraxella catarrhalis]|uniref:transferrin-binding protein-like solute binding protein n=3 Tax=Moraxella catarrhalis TaxID=480 RepID=UPI000EA9BD0B|nr:transferrin-binding protein-like solute binding protein [Moraxella catarrhalis]MCG6833247.1 transferrin-binding protein-like solute binding protein [Moraxella catarrhalis]MPX22235.1 transferrin-binding protein-like solute binding protein [Moraxella catarrhalis]RKM24958.1 transferrin-binding protein-like solute binding protein [Moraxella catarrhalis]RKM26548.1 transferrin-binding protein-like solute binding protein [Moraxella catarrhalis]RKM28105.1 transferrin-binding protein-like solute bin
MKHIPLTTLCVAISAVLLTACGGSGGSNPPAPTPIPNAGGAGNAGSGTGGAGSTDNAANAGSTDNAANAGSTGGANSGAGGASTQKPKYKDVPTDENKKAEVPDIQKPAMGFGMALSKINLYERKNTPLNEENIITLDGKKQVADNQESPLPFSLDVENKLLDGYMAKMDKADKNAIGESIKKGNKKISDEELAKQIKEAVRKSPDFQQVLSSIQAKTSHSNDKTTEATTRDLKYVDYGYYLVNDANYLTVKTDEPKLWNSGPVGGVFYNGTTTAKELPTQDAVKYKGHWDFMTDVADKGNRFSEVKGTRQAGWWYGASSKDEYGRLLTRKDSAPAGYNGEYGHSSEFTVNFKEKKLTGELFSNIQDGHKGNVNKTKRYDIKADIHGNRFRGSATAINKDNESKAKHPFTSDAKDSLEGGFYGPNAEELAGKFLTNDKKLFGVFGAKRDKVEKTEAILDAYALGTFNKNNATTFTPFTKKQLDNFGNAKKLVLGSTVINLVSTDATKNEFTEDKPKSATNKAGETLMVNDKVSVKTYGYGRNFEYLKFGELSVGGSHSVFLQGERTATTGDKAVPTEGKAKYLGNWVGYITGTGTGKSFNEAQDIADFDIDFKNKTVNGKLTTKGRTDPVFNITGEISGNGWKGKASTAKADAGGYNIDSNGTNKSIVIRDADVTGGFYGPNATEMGGSFTHNTNDSKASVVFGTKRQEEVKP